MRRLVRHFLYNLIPFPLSPQLPKVIKDIFIKLLLSYSQVFSGGPGAEYVKHLVLWTHPLQLLSVWPLQKDYTIFQFLCHLKREGLGEYFSNRNGNAQFTRAIKTKQKRLQRRKRLQLWKSFLKASKPIIPGFAVGNRIVSESGQHMWSDLALVLKCFSFQAVTMATPTVREEFHCLDSSSLGFNSSQPKKRKRSEF